MKRQNEAPHIVLMGVSGSGKSTVGRALAGRLGRPFIEGDDYHPPENVAAMAAGRALSNANRDGWIAALASAANGSTPAIIACSALNAQVRYWLKQRCNRPVRYVHLRLDQERLRERLESRASHFAGPALLDSQLAALSPPAEALTIAADSPVADLVAELIVALETQLAPDAGPN